MKFYITKHFKNNSARLIKKFPNLKFDLIYALKNFFANNAIIVPLCIYYKNEQDSISPSELEQHFDCAINELKRFGIFL